MGIEVQEDWGGRGRGGGRGGEGTWGQKAWGGTGLGRCGPGSPGLRGARRRCSAGGRRAWGPGSSHPPAAIPTVIAGRPVNRHLGGLPAISTTGGCQKQSHAARQQRPQARCRWLQGRESSTGSGAMGAGRETQEWKPAPTELASTQRRATPGTTGWARPALPGVEDEDAERRQEVGGERGRQQLAGWERSRQQQVGRWGRPAELGRAVHPAELGERGHSQRQVGGADVAARRGGGPAPSG